MAPHSSTLAWKIPWTEGPGRLQSMGLEELDTTEWLHFHFSLSCIGEGNGNPLQCSCLENPRDGGAWWAAVYGVAQSRTRLKRLSSSSSSTGPISSNIGDWDFSLWIWEDIIQPITAFLWVVYLGVNDWSLDKRQWHPTPVLLPGKIPWMDEPGRLQSMRSLRVRNDWATSLSLFTFLHWKRKWQLIPVFLPGESQGRGSLVGCCLWGRTESDTTEAT